MKIIKFNTPIPANTIRVTVSGADQHSYTVYQTKGILEYNMLKSIAHAMYVTKQRQRKTYAVIPKETMASNGRSL